MPHTSIYKTTERESIYQTSLLRRLWSQIIVLGLSLVVISLGTAWGAPSLSRPPSTLSLSFHNQQFSAHIIHAPLQKVLTTLTSYGPLRFIIEGNAKNDLISSSFTNLSFKKSLETLLLGYDYAIIQRQLHPTQQTPEFRSLMEVVIFSRNPTEQSPDSKRPSFIPSRETPAQTTLWQASQTLKKQDQTQPFDLGTANGASAFQSALEQALQDADPESLALVKELLEE